MAETKSTVDAVPPPSKPDRLVALADQFFVPGRFEPAGWPVATAPVKLPLPCAPYWSRRGELDVATYVAGEGDGPNILLIHGWEGQAADMAPFVDAVVDRGARVAGLDLPAHGHSEGQRMSIPLATQAVLAMARRHGPFDGVIAHSMGGAIAVEAMAQGLRTEVVALIAPPTHYGRRAREIARMFGLDDAQSQAFIDLLDERIGVSTDDIDMAQRLSTLSLPKGLFVHSRDDRIVSVDEVERAVRRWPDATYWQLNGLGHRRLLADAELVGRVVDFVLFAR